MKLLAGNSNLPLARSIADYLDLPLTDASVRRFADEEVFVEINENVRGEDVFVLQSTSFPANDNLMELLICIDALRRASAKRITAVLPYFGYARQDRKPGPRTPISAKLVANLITTAGANRVLSIDLHAGQIQGFFDIPTDNLFASPVIAADIRERLDGRNLMVVSPDVGGVVRARSLAKRLDNAPLAIVDKRRERAGESEVMNIIGDVAGRSCILIDDIVDSAGTLCNAAAALKQQGADGSVRLLHPRRAVGRRRGAGRKVRAERAGGDRFDRQRRGRGRRRQDPPPAASRRCSARRSSGSARKPRSARCSIEPEVALERYARHAHRPHHRREPRHRPRTRAPICRRRLDRHRHRPRGEPELGELGVAVEPLDMRDFDAVVRFGQAIDTLDLLIANAGTYGPRNPTSAEDAEAWSETFAVNTIAPFLLAQSVLPAVERSGGKLIAISTKMGSIADNGSGGFVAYRSSKSALNMAWKSLAVDNPTWSAPCSTPAGCRPGWAGHRRRCRPKTASRACAA